MYLKLKKITYFIEKRFRKAIQKKKYFICGNNKNKIRATLSSGLGGGIGGLSGLATKIFFYMWLSIACIRKNKHYFGLFGYKCCVSCDQDGLFPSGPCENQFWHCSHGEPLAVNCDPGRHLLPCSRCSFSVLLR